jgi:hypothetical protein
MDVNLTQEEAEVLTEILVGEVERMQIQTLRTDSIVYHKMMQKKTECVESIVNKLKVEQKV